MSAESSPSLFRVTHVHPLSIDLFGHADRDFGTRVRYFLPNLLFALARTGGQHTLHLLTSERRSHRFTVEGVEVIFHPCLQPPRSASVYRRFARQFSVRMLWAIRRSDADLVHFHAARALHGMLGCVGWRCRQQGLPLVAQDQGRRPVGLIEGSLQRFGLRRVSAALAANSATLAFYHGLGIPPERIHFVPNGIDPGVFFPGLEPGTVAGEPFRILFVGRIWEDKDPLTMAMGIVELARRGHPIHMKIVGAGPLRDEVCNRLIVGGVPLTVLDPVPQAELTAHYHAAHALVQTSVGEGFNSVSLEAMASGLPVVASDVPGLRDAVGEAGVLVPLGDARSLADALEGLLTDPVELHRRRRLGIERARRFTWDAIARDLQALYGRLVAEDRRPGAVHRPDASAAGEPRRAEPQG